ncbi:hypothetical protein HDV05_008758 [Chytridiales sp. JEL 0842]|nr:hypothetical protein HDV05_008758 [Chytridiales sp. JEL 0842]
MILMTDDGASPATHSSPSPPTPFQHQVAGHSASLFQLPNGLLAKPLSEIERSFYDATRSTPLSNFMPKCSGVAELKVSLPTNEELSRAKRGESIADKPDEEAKAAIPCLQLQNVLCDLNHPSIMDIKLGTRVYGEDASPEKAARMEKQARITTSGECGLRICGMKSSNVDAVPLELLEIIKQRLEDLESALREVECRVYGSSLLIAFDASAAPAPKSNERGNHEDVLKELEGKVVVKLIDFAHSHAQDAVSGKGSSTSNTNSATGGTGQSGQGLNQMPQGVAEQVQGAKEKLTQMMPGGDSKRTTTNELAGQREL